MRTYINNNQLAYFEDTQFTLCPAEEEEEKKTIKLQTVAYAVFNGF